MPHQRAMPDRAQPRHPNRQSARAREQDCRFVARLLLLPSLMAATSGGLTRATSTAAAARRNGKNGFHKRMFLPMSEPSVFPVAAGTGRYVSGRGLKPGQAAVWSLP